MQRSRTSHRALVVGLAVALCLTFLTPVASAYANSCTGTYVTCVTNNSSYSLYIGPLTGAYPGQPAAYYTLHPGQSSTLYLADTDYIAPINTSLFVTWGVSRRSAYPGQFIKIADYMPRFNCVNDSTGQGVYCYSN